jgi:SAM-dependent methyltransferase
MPDNKTSTQQSGAGSSQEQDYPHLNEYIACQNYNPITRYLHSIRYRHLNDFLQRVSPTDSLQQHKMNIVEIGCGYGKSIEALKQNPKFTIENYLGVDLEEGSIELCRKKYAVNNYQFVNANICDYAHNDMVLPFSPTAVVALECFEHILESEIPGLIDWLSSLKCPLFISVPNEIGPAIFLKNMGSALMGYVRHKEYTWAETFYAAFYHLERVQPHRTGHIGFDWRWLAANLNQKYHIFKIGTSPWNFIPRSFSPSIYFYCNPR